MDDTPVDTAISAEIRTAAASVLLERYRFLRQAGVTFGGARDLYEILGYLREIGPMDYRDRYARGGIAARIVEAMPRATWRGGWELVEDEDPKVSTEFEQAWDALEQRLQIGSWLLKTDILAGQGRYAVLLLGTANDFSVELKKSNRPEKLLYLLPFSEEEAQIVEWETDSGNERFNLPKSYMLKRNTMGKNAAGMNFVKTVHWSHVIHVAEGTLDNEVYGQPTLERVWNLLDDLDKITGGGSEAFWLRANQGLQLDVDKTMTLSPTAEAALKAEVEEYKHNISRVLKTKGVTAETLGSDVANFANPADAVITQIAGARAIPKRILTGSEMGELASSQDRDNWKDQVNGRQTSHASPVIVRPFVDRLVKHGFLPTPKQYEVRWAQIQVLTEQEKAEGAKKWADVNAAQGTPVFLEEEIRDHWYGMEPLTPEQLAKASKAKEEAVAAATPEPLADPEAASDASSGDKKATDDKKNDKKKSEPNKVVIEHKFKAGESELRDLDHSFSSTQVNLPIRLEDVKIPVDYLAEDGRETDPHVTVKYGVHAQNPNGVRSVIAGFGPVTLTLGKTATFVNKEGYDVLYVSVESPDLYRLNKLITDNLDVTNTTPSYIPHATIAYLKAGKGKQFVGLDTFEGQTFTLDQLTFSNVEGERTTIDLIEPTSVKAAEEAEDAELLQVLQAAVEAGNTSVIDAIIGIQRKPEPPREHRVLTLPRAAGGPGSGRYPKGSSVSDAEMNAPARSTIQVNNVLKQLGYEEHLIKGNGYLYFDGGDSSSWYTSSVATARVSNMSPQRWVEERNSLASDKRNSDESLNREAKRLRGLTARSPRWLAASIDAIEFTDRYQALGIPYPDTKTMCRGQCEGTGYIPIYMDVGDDRSGVHGESETDPTLIALWQAAEQKSPEDDGWHFVVCPDCKGTGLRTAGGPGSGRYPKGSGGNEPAAPVVMTAAERRGSDVQTAAEQIDPVFQDLLTGFVADQLKDPDVSEFEKLHPVVMARAYRESMRPYEEHNDVGSDANYQTDDGSYTLERQAVHNSIVDSYISKFRDPQETPRVIITGGLPGAGKSTGLRETAGDTSLFTTVNNDDVKALLPEFNGGAGAAWLHVESDYVARDILRHAVAARQNIVLDVTMKSAGVSKVPTLEDGLGGRIQALKEAGYRTSMVFTEIDVKESAQRALTRYVAEGRFVPPDYIRSARTEGPLKTKNRETFEQIKSLVSDWKQFKSGAPATTVEGIRTSKPTFVSEGKNS